LRSLELPLIDDSTLPDDTDSRSLISHALSLGKKDGFLQWDWHDMRLSTCDFLPASPCPEVLSLLAVPNLSEHSVGTFGPESSGPHVLLLRGSRLSAEFSVEDNPDKTSFLIILVQKHHQGSPPVATGAPVAAARTCGIWEIRRMPGQLWFPQEGSGAPLG
jgi:hypothetical protein